MTDGAAAIVTELAAVATVDASARVLVVMPLWEVTEPRRLSAAAELAVPTRVKESAQ
jgi:hypothetical protein